MTYVLKALQTQSSFVQFYSMFYGFCLCIIYLPFNIYRKLETTVLSSIGSLLHFMSASGTFRSGLPPHWWLKLVHGVRMGSELRPQKIPYFSKECHRESTQSNNSIGTVRNVLSKGALPITIIIIIIKTK